MKTSNIGNLISNYGNRLWSLVSVFIFIPVYIHYLGIESYAVVGFYALLLGIISFADAGMSSAVIKEFASNSDASYKYNVLRIIEKYYILICLFIALVIIACSGTIATYWLNSDKIPIGELVYTIRLIGVGITLQLLSSLYFGALFGLGKQIKANSFQIFWNIMKSGFVILLLILVRPTLEVFFIWQIICNLTYVVILRRTVIGDLKTSGDKMRMYLKSIPKDILSYIGGMTFIAIVSAVNIQADKIITSSFFSLKIFGYYTIASTLSQIPVIMGTPLALSMFPLFSKYSTKETVAEFNNCFVKSTFLLHSIIFPVSIILYIYTADILRLWTGTTVSAEHFDELIIVIKFLVIGSTFLALQLLPFYVLLSNGKTKYNIYQGVAQIVVGLPLLYFSVKYYGLLGTGFPWMVINFGALIFLYIIVFKYFIAYGFFKFLRTIIILPFVINFVISVAIYYLYKSTSLPFYIFVVLTGIVSISSNLIIYNLSQKKKALDFSNIFSFSTE